MYNDRNPQNNNDSSKDINKNSQNDNDNNI